MKKIESLKTIFFLVSIVCCFAFNATIVKAGQSMSHAEMAKNFLNETMQILNDNRKTDQQKRQVIVDKYIENINFEWNAKSALGRPFLQLSKQEQKEYTEEYTKFLIYSWLPKLSYNKESGIQISVADKTEKINNTDADVNLIIIMKDGTKYEILLRTRITKENKFEVLNLYFEGIDLASSYRAQFISHMEQNKNDPKSIIDYLKKQNEEKKKMIDFKIMKLK